MVPLYRLTGEKCNFCTYSVSGALNGPPYMLTGKKWCSKWSPYIGKVQFPHLLCYLCSLIVEIATFWPHLVPIQVAW